MLRAMYHQAITGNYEPHGDPAKAEIILVPAFGRDSHDMGASNEALARLAIDYAERYSIKIVAQFAVANAIRAHDRETLLEASIDPRTPREQLYMDTNHVVGRAAEVIGGRPTLLLAQRYHVPRADAIAQKKGIDTIVPPDLPDIWDPNNISQERHCNSLDSWKKREWKAIAYSWVLHQI